MWRRRRKHEDFSAEIQAHLELEHAELVENGMSEDEARSSAAKRFGNRAKAEEVFYEGTRWIWLDHLWHDALLSARGLRRSPGFTAAVVVTLALAIGAGTAIFNVADEALFRPLPLPEAEQLTAIYNYDQNTAAYLDSSYPDYVDYRDHARSFEQVSAYVRLPMAVAIGSQTLRPTVEAVTPEYFSMLRLTPLIGSTFGSEAAPEVLLSERLWRELLGADPKILGSMVRIERQPFSVVGVIPEHYRGANLSWSEPPEIWIPMRAASIAIPRLSQVFGIRSARWLVILGRRKAGVGVAEAQAELQTLAANIALSEPANKGISAVAFEARRSKFWPAFREDVTLSLGVFGIAAALVLLLACANISNLLLERALARRREIAVQVALGAPRARLIRQMLVESFLLVVPGFLGALLVSGVLAKLLARYPSAIGGVTLTIEAGTDVRVLVFGLLLSVVAVGLFGLVPALKATPSAPQVALNASGSRVTGRKEQWLREVMVVVQIAFTTILLIGGGLFVRSLLRGYAIDPGFRSDHLIVSTFDFNAVPPASRGAFTRRLVEESTLLPGIESAAVSPHVPLTSSGAGKAEVSTPAAKRAANLSYAGAGFFHAMNIPVREGREFAPGDRLANIAIVSQDLAAQLGPESPIGRKVLLRRGAAPVIELEIVGVANPVRAASVWKEPEPQIYVPWETSTQTWILRTRSDPASQLQQVRDLWNRMTTDIPLWDLRTGDEVMQKALAPQRLAVRLFAAFGLLAITLASVGLYSLTSCSVARRTREIGIRIAIGAMPGVVVRRILGRALLLAILGLSIGIVTALKLARLASPLVREVAPNDTVTFLLVIGSMLVVSGLATLAPAIRAARIAPALALKSD